MAKEIDDNAQNAWPGQQADILHGIAVLQTNAGETLAALEIARRFEDGEQRVITLCAIAEAQLEANEKQQARATVAEALEIAKGVGDHEKRLRGLGALAVAQAKIGSMEDAQASLASALQFARDFTIMSQRDTAFHTIGKAQAKVGDISTALALVEEIKDHYTHARALHAIASAQIDIGKKDAASYTLSMAFNFARSVSRRVISNHGFCVILG
jgi:tetratricopeptide (TPR) repeat protein